MLIWLSKLTKGSMHRCDGGYEFRARLVKAIGGSDLPIALLEDSITIIAAVLIVSRFC